MSILKKPYEISVWEDEWEPGSGKFVEKRIFVIGSDKMADQSRALEPNLTKNANGTKKFSFKMYGRYIDNITGKEVVNPFVEKLLAERKVKLKVRTKGVDKWYDFIIKDVSENSSTYLYTYQLEDALVQELSKNGFGITLNADLQNNIGNAKELAEYTLRETDWDVESETFVQTVEENLVYLVATKNWNTVYHITDQQQDPEGLKAGISATPTELKEGSVVLAFYSSCKNKPHRFQFIYVPIEKDKNGEIIKGYSSTRGYILNKDDNRKINEKDCQYYIDFENPETAYQTEDTTYALSIPENFSIVTLVEAEKTDSTLSSWYRGARYGFAQQSVYVPALKKYCNKFTTDGEDWTYSGANSYLGFVESEYRSPSLIQNCITNYNFEGSSGWRVSSDDNTSSLTEKAQVESCYGRFVEVAGAKKFKTIAEDFIDGEYADSISYIPYMKLGFNSKTQFALNSGMRDNRSSIKNMPKGEEWILDVEILNEQGETVTNSTRPVFSLGEYTYSSFSHSWGETTDKIAFIVRGPEIIDSKLRYVFTVDSTVYTESTFKEQSEIYLKIAPPNDQITYYIKNISLYRKSVNDNGEIIVPDYEDTNSEAAEAWVNEAVLESKYKYFKASLVNPEGTNIVTSGEDIDYDVKDKLTYETYKPVYNFGAEKVRAITVQESNYFNILQSIAETFEAWLDLEITRDDFGGILNKKVRFKNYLGSNNPASFRYGVNLKDIQRTSSSKNIVTKLIVKQNSNTLGKDGFCTIQRAGANPTGENYIYDFQYYQNQGLMDPTSYLNLVYKIDGAVGHDYPLWSEGYVSEPDERTNENINGYFLRLSKLNKSILPLNQKIVGLQTDLVKDEAKLKTAEYEYKAALNGLEQTREEFKELTKVYPEETQNGGLQVQQVISCEPRVSLSVGELGVNYSWDNTDTKRTLTLSATRKLSWEAKATDEGIMVPISQKIDFKPTSSTHDMMRPSDNGFSMEYKRVLDAKAQVCFKGQFKKNFDYDLSFTIYPRGGLSSESKYTLSSNHSFQLVQLDKNKNSIQNTNVSKTTSCVVSPTEKTRYFKIVSNFEVSDISIDNSPVFTITREHDGKEILTTWAFEDIAFYENGYEVSEEKVDGILEKQINRVLNETEYFYVTLGYDLNNTLTRLFSIPIKYTEQSLIKKPNEGGVGIYEVQLTGITNWDVPYVDIERDDVQRRLTEYTKYSQTLCSSTEEKQLYSGIVEQKKKDLQSIEETRKQYIEWKAELNKLFFKRYSRFIQEGTWISEEYVDDEKYYVDALSVMYNSCYPQVVYSINVLALSALPEYEGFDFELGDKTNVIDEKFFGNNKVEVIITETSERLDEPDKNSIRVQTFKNQFQDLFQKITATVQQARYSEGSYKKGAALVEASNAEKTAFFTDAMNAAQAYLEAGATVVQDESGITVTKKTDPLSQVKIVGGAILFGKEDPNTKLQTWVTGVTNEGISASHITTGQLDTGTIQIMSGREPVFRWDAYGISAFDAYWSNLDGISTISGVNPHKFVRFDKYGIYGINSKDKSVNGLSWHPTGESEEAQKAIDERATFALTWEGLKVTGEYGTVARMGKLGNNIFRISKNTEDGEEDYLTFSTDGKLTVGGWSVDQNGLTSVIKQNEPKAEEFEVYFRAIPNSEESVEKWITDETANKTDNIVLKAGENFKVSKNGTIYASAGYIGDWIINEGILESTGEIVRADGSPYLSSLYLKSGYIKAVNYQGNAQKSILNPLGLEITSSNTFAFYSDDILLNNKSIRDFQQTKMAPNELSFTCKDKQVSIQLRDDGVLIVSTQNNETYLFNLTKI